jgi:hypothetical protein
VIAFFKNWYYLYDIMVLQVENNMDTLTLKIPEILKSKLNRYAKQKGLSRSEIVRKALSDFFSEGGVRLGAFLDFSEDLAGSIEGPSDLSSNKKYLDGYGK